MNRLLCLLWLVPLALTGCAAPSPAPTPSPTGHHEHHPPHHGTLVELGEEFAHVEMVVDASSGKVTAYVLDGEAQNPVRVSQRTLGLHFIQPKLPDADLPAVPNTLTGETVGDTSEFEVVVPSLKGVSTFDGEIKDITARGTRFQQVKFNYPRGNELPH